MPGNVFAGSWQLQDNWDRRAGVGAAAAEAWQSSWSRCRGWMGELRSFLGSELSPRAGIVPSSLCTATGDLHHTWGEVSSAFPSRPSPGDDSSRSFCWSSCFKLRSLSPAVGGMVSAEQELLCTGKLDLFWDGQGACPRQWLTCSCSLFMQLLSFTSHHYGLTCLFPQPGAMETVAVTISEYSKVSHFYLKEITYYK